MDAQHNKQTHTFYKWGNYAYLNICQEFLAKNDIIFTKTFCGTGMRLIVCGVLFSVVTVRRCKFLRYTIYGIIGINFFVFSFDYVVTM